MSLNFNVSPYYDDFDPTKNYYRVLFKPGYAVQARELTQSQSILQDQVSKFGAGVFADGSKISGGNITVDTKIVTCKLTSAASQYISNYNNLFAVGQTSNFIIQVNSIDATNFYISGKAVNVQNGASFSSGEIINFYTSKTDALGSLYTPITPQYTATVKTITTLTKTSSGTYLSKVLSISTGNVSVGDTINIPSISFTATVTSIVDANTLNINIPLPQDLTSVSTTITNQISVNAMEINIDNGVWFTNGVFVANYKNSIVPDTLNAYPSAVVGFEVVENIISSSSDPSLLDPALGASNYQAPGADRYNIVLNLVVKPYVSDQTVTNLTSSKFIELVRINVGVVEDLNNVPILTDVATAIAQSVSDTAGDFILNPFNLLIYNNNPSTNTFTSSISAGKAYINGYPVQHIAPTAYYLEKSRDITSLTNQNIITYFGNYTKIKNLNGSILNFQRGAQVELHNVAFGLVNTNTKIGTANIRDFDYDNGNLSSTQYKAFLFNVSLANNTFANVNSFIIPGAGNNYTSVSFSANTVSANNLVDNNYNSLIFPFPQTNISNVSSVNYVTRRYFNAATFSNGSYTFTTNGANEIFEPGSGTLGSTQAQLYFSVVTTSSSGSYAAGTYIPMDQANVSVTINNSAATPQATINIAGGFNGSATIYATIGVSNDSIKTKTLNTNATALVSANTVGTPIDIGYSDIYQFKGFYELGNTASYLGAWSSSTTYSTNNAVSFTDGSVYISLQNSNTNQSPNTAISYWSVVTNNTSNYLTDNGQRDAFYDHGTITNNSGAAKGNVVVVFDYFTHSGGQGFFTVQSYPLDYASIPSFTSPQYGSTYNLRDVIDFRPRRTDGVGVTTFNTFQLPAPFATEYVTGNYGYYLARTDKIVLYPNGQFKTIRGTSSYTNPITPSDVPGALTLFTIFYPAYTFSKSSVVVTPTVLRRYSMRDIGLLDKRISNLEYYTALSFLEGQVTGSNVTDATGQNILFKNGYLVDSFSGSGVGDVSNPDYAISIDPVAQLARPVFISDVASYSVNQNQGTFVTSPGKTNNKLSLKNNLITFSYNEYSLVFQNVATEIIDVNPFNVVDFIGNAALSPASDVWYSTTTSPNVNIVNEDQQAWINAGVQSDADNDFHSTVNSPTPGANNYSILFNPASFAWQRPKSNGDIYEHEYNNMWGGSLFDTYERLSYWYKTNNINTANTAQLDSANTYYGYYGSSGGNINYNNGNPVEWLASGGFLPSLQIGKTTYNWAANYNGMNPWGDSSGLTAKNFIKPSTYYNLYLQYKATNGQTSQSTITGNGTQWNDWQLNWSGLPTDTIVNSTDGSQITRDTTAIKNAISSEGLTTALQGGPIQVSSTTQVISNAVIPYARSVPINFTVKGLSPFTQIHTFINGSIADTYVNSVVPNRVYGVSIINAGSGYTNGNNLNIITVSGANTIPAIVTANVSGGSIVAINVLSPGDGYQTAPTLTVTGSNTSIAVLSVNNANTSNPQPLFTDINGSASGVLTLPDGVYPAGTLILEWSNNPITPTLSQCYAKGSFYSQGTLQTLQTTVTSTRPPNVTPRAQVDTQTVAPVTNPDYTTPATDTTPKNPVVNPPTPSSAYSNSTSTNNSWNPYASEFTSVSQGIGPVLGGISQLRNSIIGSGSGTVGLASFIGSMYAGNGIDASASYNAIYAAAQKVSGLSAPPLSTVTTLANQVWTGIATTGQGNTILADANQTLSQTNAILAGITTSCTNTVTGTGTDPLSQNFFVTAQQYPNGVFLSSVDLYFAFKDPSIPVSVRIRPTVNGYPDAVYDIPGTIVYKNPSDINVNANTTSGIGPATTFTFDYPIYLQPGQYSVMVASNSNKYKVYASKLGQPIYGTTNVLTQISYAGSLFKSQNSSTWVPAPSETLCFNLKICDFAGGSVTFDATSNTTPSFNYDLMQLMNNDLSFNSLDSINYKVLTKDASTSSQIGPNSIVPHQNYNFTTEQNITAASDIIIRPTVTNIDRFTSPVIDLERLNTILVKNIVTPYYSANTTSESSGGFYNGGAVARYITRRVTLNNNFNSTGITVYVDVNRPSGTKIEVYYKVLNVNDSNSFDSQKYVLMSPILTPGSGLVTTDAIHYTEDTYQALNISYNDITTNALYKSFNTFAIKIVMYSNNPTVVPQIKNFRAIATA